MHPHETGAAVDVTAAVLGAVLLLGLGAYLACVVRAHLVGRTWPVGRTTCAVLGVLSALVALGPVGRVAHHSFVAHMWGHLLLGMVAPLFLVSAAPVTAVMRGLPVATARRVSAWLGSPLVRVLAHPVTAAVLDVGGLWLLYTTPLHGWMHTSTLVHLVVHAHVLLAGVVFTAAVLQVDPVRHPHGPRLRGVALVGFLAAHAVLAKIVYAHPPAGVAAEQARAGAELMYYGGDFVDLVLIVLFCWGVYRRTAPRDTVRAEADRVGVPLTASDRQRTPRRTPGLT